MFCRYCGKQINDGSIFCKHCGASLAPQKVQQETVTAEQQVQSPPLKQGAAESSDQVDAPQKKSKNVWMSAAVITTVIVLGAIFGLVVMNGTKKFASHSEKKQKQLMTELYERLNQHFVSDLQIHQQLAQLLIYEDESMADLIDDAKRKANENEGKEIGIKIGMESMEIVDKWSKDNKLDFEDLKNNVINKEWVTEYIEQLIALANEVAKEEIATMKKDQQKAMLIYNLYDYLDEFLIPIVLKNEQLMNFILGEATENSETLKSKLTMEMAKVIEQWAKEVPNKNIEDWPAQALIDDFLAHCLSNAVSESEKDWIVGEWAPDREEGYAESEVIRFDAEGRFSTGEDCTSNGVYTLRGFSAILKGTTKCPDSDDDDEYEYNETKIIYGQSLVGYSKVFN